MARTSSVLLNESDKSRYHCLFPDIREKQFSVSQLSMKLAVGFADVFYFLKLIIEFRGLIRLRCNFLVWGKTIKV